MQFLASGLSLFLAYPSLYEKYRVAPQQIDLFVIWLSVYCIRPTERLQAAHERGTTASGNLTASASPLYSHES
jgi:hypothetical protein